MDVSNLRFQIDKYLRPERVRLERPVFIVGCGRSGTTILGRVLGKHPQITYLNEPRNVWLNEPRTDIWSEQASDRAGKLYLGAEDVTLQNARKIREDFAFIVYQQGTKRLVEKLPINSFRIHFIRAIFPQARFIHLLRNGVAVAQSIERETKKYAWYGVNNYKWHLLADYANTQGLAHLVTQAESDMLLRGLLEWRLSVSTAIASLATLPEDDHITIRYETLLAEPIQTIKTLETFIDVSADAKTHEFAGETINNAKKLMPLTSVMREITGDLLHELGYDVDSST